MTTETLSFDQNRLLDHLLNTMKLKNDAALSRVLSVAPPVISKIRHHRLPVGPAIKIRILEKFDLTVHQVNHLIGVPVA
jgi:hypothetical protein